jgi:hypothetical protein
MSCVRSFKSSAKQKSKFLIESNAKFYLKEKNISFTERCIWLTKDIFSIEIYVIYENDAL